MAKNWSVSEALQVITKGENLGAIKDIGRRFPLFLFFVLHNPLKIIEAFGNRATARTVNKQLELGILDVDKTVEETEEYKKPIIVDRMDHVEKGAKIGKSREAKKEEKKKEEDEMKKMQKGEMPKDRLMTDKEVIELRKREEATKKEDEKDKVEKENKSVKKDEKTEVKEKEKIDDEQVTEDDLDFSVEDLLEE